MDVIYYKVEDCVKALDLLYMNTDGEQDRRTKHLKKGDILLAMYDLLQEFLMEDSPISSWSSSTTCRHPHPHSGWGCHSLVSRTS